MKEMVFAQQRNRELTFELVKNYESRGTSVAAMIKELEQKMFKSAKSLEFEEAARIRDEVQRLKDLAFIQ